MFIPIKFISVVFGFVVAASWSSKTSATDKLTSNSSSYADSSFNHSTGEEGGSNDFTFSFDSKSPEGLQQHPSLIQAQLLNKQEIDDTQESLDSLEVERELLTAAIAHHERSLKRQAGKQKRIKALNKKLAALEETMKVVQTKIDEAQIKKDEAVDKLRVEGHKLYNKKQKVERVKEWPKVKQLQIKIIELAINEKQEWEKIQNQSERSYIWVNSFELLNKAQEEVVNLTTKHLTEDQKRFRLTINGKPKTIELLESDLAFVKQQLGFLEKTIQQEEIKLSEVHEKYKSAEQEFNQTTLLLSEAAAMQADNKNLHRYYSGNINYLTEKFNKDLKNVQNKKNTLDDFASGVKKFTEECKNKILALSEQVHYTKNISQQLSSTEDFESVFKQVTDFVL